MGVDMAKHFNGDRPRHLRAATPGEAPPTDTDTLVDAVQSAVDEFKAQVASSTSQPPGG